MKVLLLAACLVSCVGAPDRVYVEGTTGDWDGDSNGNDADYQWLTLGLEFPITYTPERKKPPPPPLKTDTKEAREEANRDVAWYRDPGVREWILGLIVMLGAGERGYRQYAKKKS